MGNKGSVVNQKVSYKSLLPIFLLIMLFFNLHSCTSAHIKLKTNAIIIENVPFYPQKEFQCGPASLAAVLNFWGLEVTPDEIAEKIFSKSARGTLTIDMLLYANKMGLSSAQYKGGWEDLKENINKGFPLIVLVDYGIKPFFQANHFMVIIGYNEEGVIANSEKKENLFIEKEEFLKLWGKTDYWTLLIKGAEIP